MVRFFFRMFAYLALAVSVLFAVIDATRSIGISHLEYTPFGESFQLGAPLLLQDLTGWLAANAPQFVSEDLLAMILHLPTFAVFAFVAFLLYAIGHQPERRGLRTYAI